MSTSPPDRSLRPLRILGLACLSLLFPVLSVVNNLDGGSPASVGARAELTWLLIGILWILIVWLTGAPRPLATLILAGSAGGVLTVIVVAVIQLTSSGTASIFTSPAGVLAMIALSMLGGLVCGLIAWDPQPVTRKRNP